MGLGRWLWTKGRFWLLCIALWVLFYRLGWSILLAIGLATAIEFGLSWLSRRRVAASLLPAPDSELEQRLRAACGEAGFPDLQPEVVQAPEPFFQRTGNRLLIARPLGALLDEAELVALIRYECIRGADPLRRLARLQTALPLVVMVLCLIPLFTVSATWTLPLLAVGLALPALYGRGQLGYRGRVRRVWHQLQTAGADASRLLTALFKVWSEYYRLGQRKSALAFAEQIGVLAEVSGLGPNRLLAIARAVDTPEAMPRWRAFIASPGAFSRTAAPMPIR